MRRLHAALEAQLEKLVRPDAKATEAREHYETTAVADIDADADAKGDDKNDGEDDFSKGGLIPCRVASVSIS